MPSATEFDVVVAGSGAAGMTGALAAARRGLRTVVIEKAATFGGSTARSGGGVWVPGNAVVLAAGVPDSPEAAASYLARVAGADVPVERQQAFLDAGPEMLSFVLRHTPLRFRWMAGYPHYYPELPGGQPGGRSIEPEPFDGNLLGAELAHLNPTYLAAPRGSVILGADYPVADARRPPSPGPADRRPGRRP
jgi:3-oxosteroid 1-dehydrogenase